MTIASSCVAAVAILVATAPLASAQAPEAEALFREGKRLMKKGEIAEACDKFEASERLEPQSGTELNLADCREKNGQTASAWADFVKAAASARRAEDHDREAEARRRAKVLEKQLVYLTISVGDHPPDGLVVKKNDEPVDKEEWDQALPIDPGDYTISAEAPGRKTWSDRVVIKSKDKTVEIPELDREREHKHHKPPPDDVAAVHARDDHRPPGVRRYRKATIVLASIGVAAAATATGFALYSRDLENQAEAACPRSTCTDKHASDLNRVARMDGWIANIGWGVGGAVLVSAAVTWWLGRPVRDSGVAIAPLVSPGEAGLVLGGHF